jgi:hypothetical protein
VKQPVDFRKEIKSETNLLWSIEIKRQNVDVCKGFDEEVISVYICKTSAIHTNLSMLNSWDLYNEKNISQFFLVIGGSPWLAIPRIGLMV